MVYRTRLKYTPEMKSYIWDKYEEGNSICSIGRSFDRPSSSIHRQIALTGGIRPPERKRRSQALSLAEREEISRGIVAGKSIRAIAVELDRKRQRKHPPCYSGIFQGISVSIFCKSASGSFSNNQLK